ncbi:uncharacterized protein LOC133640258 isoform X2 [Entelurus aequoreus]|uniref:uncharacterized protein LOC133640258 isoform X2 n=1 Tax=Entelurus aequoreus TaxID=161455 RepID=UPI002B1DA12F|nr:uncharacterized protein LOC133640258 isoform X2 [Entelurus aequoreus]
MYSYAFTSTCIKHAESYTSSYHLGAPFRVPFHLIKFIMNRDIAVVPSGWYDDWMVFWPSYKNTDRIERAALNVEQHEPNWPRFDVSVVRTCDNYKDALKIMQQYGKGCDTSGLQSEAENEELPEKRNRKLVHRLGDSDDSEEDPGNSDLASLGTSPWGRTHSYAFTSTCIKHAESYTRNGSPSSTPFTPLTSSPQHVADTGAWIQPGLQANMARGKNGRQHFLLCA